MREDKLILFMRNYPNPHPIADLGSIFGISKRTVLNDLTSLNAIGKTKGFQIINIRGKGYKLSITNEEKFLSYIKTLLETDNNDIFSPQSRKENIELLLLLSNNYITLTQIADTFKVSVSTIKGDLVEVKKDFEKMNLTLVSKPHYGFYVAGEEEERRAFIIRLIRNDMSKPMFTKEYQEFLDSFNFIGLKAFLTELINQANIRVNDLVLDNLVQHIFLLAFRIKQHNFLKKQEHNAEMNEIYLKLAKDVAQYIKKVEKITLDKNEEIYLSQQLFGKIVTISDPNQHAELKKLVYDTLRQLDVKYQTIFHQDKDLVDALTLHCAPLLQRLYINRQLDNPLIDDVYTQYANVFNIAFEFIEEISGNAKINISKDEAGYLAIYFAASLEKQIYNSKNLYRKIAVICATGGGASFFVKTKLEQIFSNAQVETFSLTQIQEINSSFDLIITTVPLKKEFSSIPIIRTQALLTEAEINKIQKDLFLIQESKGNEESIDEQLLSLFSSINFKVSQEKDYLKILKEEGKRLEKEKWADKEFTSLVLQRENLIDTVYQMGVAGPHPMESKAIKECIDVIICRDCVFKEKPVKLIFLINISNNHLVLHKEISRLMIKIIKDDALDKELNIMSNFEDFFYYIKELMKKG